MAKAWGGWSSQAQSPGTCLPAEEPASLTLGPSLVFSVQLLCRPPEQGEQRPFLSPCSSAVPSNGGLRLAAPLPGPTLQGLWCQEAPTGRVER